MAWWIFQSLVTTAALAAAVALVCRFGRIGPVARHALWVIVLGEVRHAAAGGLAVGGARSAGTRSPEGRGGDHR